MLWALQKLLEFTHKGNKPVAESRWREANGYLHMLCKFFNAPHNSSTK